MGPENKIDWNSGGILYVSKLDGSGDIKMIKLQDVDIREESFEFPEVPDYISKIISMNEPIEFTGTCEITFRGMVKLMGFWPAVKWAVSGWVAKVKKLLKEN